MANPRIADIECPFCGEVASVHREAKGRRRLYIRCYDADGAQRCGTLQCRGPKGQEYIEQHARWLDLDGQDEAAAETAAETVEQVRAERRKRSRISRIADSLSGDSDGA